MNFKIEFLIIYSQISHSSFILSSSKLMDPKRKSNAKDVSAYGRYIHDVAVLLGAQPSGQTDNTTIDRAFDIIMFESELAKVLFLTLVPNSDRYIAMGWVSPQASLFCQYKYHKTWNKSVDYTLDIIFILKCIRLSNVSKGRPYFP